MNQIISETMDINCTHENKVSVSGKVICRSCGIELDTEYVNNIYHMGSFSTKKNNHNRRYVGNPQTQRYSNDALGSYIKTCDTFGKVMENGETRKYQKLSRINKLSSTKKNQKQYISFIILNKIGNYLQLPKYILDDTALRFKKIVNSEVHIINRVSCLCYCLWDSIKHFKYRTCLKDLLDAFNRMGHKARKKLILRDGLIYNKILAKKGLKKTSPKTMGDYIARQIASLRNDIKSVEKRLEVKNFSIDSNFYISEIEKLCYEIVEKMKNYLLYKGINPSNASASCVYFASRLIAKKYNTKTIITQKYISDLSNVPSYCIREIFLSVFKPILLKNTDKKSKN